MKQAFLGLVSVKTLKNNYLSVAIVAAFLLISLCSSAQSYDSSKVVQDINAYGYRYKNINLRHDGSLRIPTDTIKLAYADSGAIATKRGVVFTYNGRYWQGAAGGSGTIIITDTTKGIDSITYNGYSMCWYPHDSITPRCWQLNTFFDDVRLSDDSTLYEFYNGDSLVKTVPSGIKNVGAVWPLSYDGVDLTTSKPFNDSLYLSSLVLHGTSLYSKKLTGDSVFVGTVGSGGSSGIDSMYISSDSVYQVFIYHSGRRDSVVLYGSSSLSGGIDSMFVTSDSLYQVFVYHSGRRDSVNYSGSSGGSGVTSFSSGNLSPLFTTSIATATSTPALSFTLSNAAAYTNFGNNTSSSAAPTFFTNNFSDSLKRSTDSIFRRVNGNWYFQYKDSIGAGGSGWLLTGNSLTDSSVNFIGTTDSVALIFRVKNVRSGLISRDTSSGNTTFGFQAGMNLRPNDSSTLSNDKFNVAIGNQALQVNHSSIFAPNGYSNFNVAIGHTALRFNTNGYGNVAIGTAALYKNTTGVTNMAIGHNALFNNTTGSSSVAVGDDAGKANTTGRITAIGYQALTASVTSLANTAIGYQAALNTTGANNTAVGEAALQGNVGGYQNTAVGFAAMSTAGNTESAAFGYSAGQTNAGNFNTSIGNRAGGAATSGSSNTSLGYEAGNSMGSASGRVNLGYQAGRNSTASNKLFINNTSTGALIYGDFSTGQIQINSASTPALTTGAAFEIKSTTGSFIPPVMTSTQASALTTVKGSVVYVTDTNGTFTTAGLWMYGTSWKLILAE